MTRRFLPISTLLHCKSNSVEDEGTATTFTSAVMKVYIEDTDAYGVMYNANYLRSYERALAVIIQDPDWSVVHLTNQKFKSSPLLGGCFVVRGVQHDNDRDSWDVMMTCPDTGIIYNTATVTVGSIDCNDDTNIVSVQNNSIVTHTTHYDTLHRDEFDPHHPNHLPLRSVLNLCERARSNYKGGPNALRKLQENDSILVVVTAIKDCYSMKHHSCPGESVRVETEIVPKRLACDCRHFLLDSKGQLMAKATVTLISLNATTKRPTYKEGLWGGILQ